jgi:predicted GTPase
MLHDVINYHHVSFALAIIIGVALRQYKEYMEYQEPLNVIIIVSRSQIIA